MSELDWRMDERIERLRRFFPKSCGKPRVNDRRVLSGIRVRSALNRSWMQG
jgi:hypothetical protein